MIKQYGGYEAKKSGSAREIIPAGGYVCKIVNAKVEDTQYGSRLIVAFDVAEGDYKEFFKRDFDGNTNEDKKWRGVYRLNIPADDGSEKDEWRKKSFNNFTACVQESNDGYVWNWDEKTLKDKFIGVLFRNKEWEINGKSGWTTEASNVTDVDAIRKGKFRIPKDKPLSGSPSASTSFKPVDEGEEDGELPF